MKYLANANLDEVGLKKVIWALFDSENGCYYNTLKDKAEVYCVGMQRDGSHDNFINLDLGTGLYGLESLKSELSKLPKPYIILASPPCETWSNATNCNGGNFYWKNKEANTLFGSVIDESFTIRSCQDGGGTAFTEKFTKDIIKQFRRINGELCLLNTLQIIKLFEPKVWVIENPDARLQKYVKEVAGWDFINNITYYDNWDDNYSHKRENFISNINLDLKFSNKNTSKSITFVSTKKKNYNKLVHGKSLHTSYSERSNIPEELILKIFEMATKK